jgi:hypothetical protein
MQTSTVLSPCPECATSAERLSEKLDAVLAALASIDRRVDGLHQLLSGCTKSHYTVAELATMTGRSSYTVRRWVSKRRLSAKRVEGSGPRGRLLIARSEIERMLAAGLGSGVPSACAGITAVAHETSCNSQPDVPAK